MAKRKTALDPIDILQMYVDILRRLQKHEYYIPEDYAYSLSLFRNDRKETWKTRTCLSFVDQCNTTHVGTSDALLNFVKTEIARLDEESKDPESDASVYKRAQEEKAKELRRKKNRERRMRCYYRKKQEKLNQQKEEKK